MDQVKISLSFRCPEHKAQPIGMLNVDPGANKVAYCYECIEKTHEDGIFIKTLKSLPSYLKESSSFYEKCRQRIGEPPANYTEELAKKGEYLEKFSKYIDQEKDKVKRNFEEIRKKMIQIIDQKEKDCLQLLDKEILGLSEAYIQFEKLLSTGWPKPAEIQSMYPEPDVLIQKISRIENIDQLQAFMAGVHDDIQKEKIDDMEKNGLERRENEIDRLIRCFNIPDSSLPKAKSKLLDLESFEALIKDFTQQKVQIENSILARMSLPYIRSKIISDDQSQILKDWLPKGYKFDLKLLYRGSVDGMSSQVFHERCDGKGPTITIVKSRFDGALESRNLGGFIDQSWHSNRCCSTSSEAFLFSLSDQKNSVKCPISRIDKAFFGSLEYGPTFGADLEIEKKLKTGFVNSKYYSNTNALCNGDVKTFRVEEIEVFQVQ